MYIVTGGAGFIGSNLVHQLNREGINDLLIVDNLADPGKLVNLHGARFSDYMDKREFRRALQSNALSLSRVEAIFHQGACSNTLNDDGVYMMDNNFSFSRDLLAFAEQKQAPFIYASTAAVYGLSGEGKFTPDLENEKPLNVYGFSKLAFDHYVRERIRRKDLAVSVVGLRYFNVYGPREQHKGRMASVVHHFTEQIKKQGRVRLFEGCAGYAEGEQRRDFVYVQDLVRLNLYFAQVGSFARENQGQKATFHGVVNAGTGRSRTFNEMARALMAVHGEVPVEYVPMPADLVRRYQHYTQAELTGLRQLGCTLPFTSIEDGVRQTFATIAEIEGS